MRIQCANNLVTGRASAQICRGLKIPRRKACRFDSGPGHHSYIAMVVVAIGASLGASLAHSTMKTALLLALCLSLPAMAGQRSAAEVLAFKRAVPCPATGKPELRCPGYQADHATPLCAGGADHRDNLQWLTIEEHRMKTRSDVRFCRQLRKESAKQRSE